MTASSRYQISLYEEAKAGLNSLVKQTAQVGAGFLIMLLLTGGNPPALIVTLSCIAGIGFVAWSEEKRITKQRVIAKKFILRDKIKEQVKHLLETETQNFAELVKTAGLNPSEDFAGANLVGVKAVGCNLSSFNLSGADLSEADLSRADLSNANLSGANLTNANLSSANLNDANLRDANLNNTMLFLAQMINTDLSNAKLSNANLILANLTDANLNHANLSRVNLTSAKLWLADLSEVDMSSVEVKNAQFGQNAGLADDAKYDLEQRGAIFPQDELALMER